MDLCDSHLLVVDDSASMRTSICELLRDLGFTHIDEAADGAAAITLFQRTPYDVVITDWYMPRANGLQLLRSIRSGAQRSPTPVLMLTGNATSARQAEALEAGATGFIVKPSVAPTLCEKVLRLVAALHPATAVESAPDLLRASA
jgi:two-component system chemotaxis response regulator CheY